MKELAKAALPKTIWRLLVRAMVAGQQVSTRVAHFLCHAILHTLPMQEAVKIIESLSFFAPLDYGKGDVRFKISTYGEYKRATRACAKEPGTVAWIESRFEPGDVIFDIGANVGAYSFVANTHLAGRCRIYAFEPSFSTFASLCGNVCVNGSQDSIFPLQIALSDTTGLATFRYSNIKPGAAFHSVGESADDQTPVLVVGWDEQALAQRGLSGFGLAQGVMFHPVLAQPTPTFRMDDLVVQLGLPRPNHIKIDVDGAEFKVIEGAREVLARPELRSLLIELDKDSLDRMKAALAPMGFVVTEVYPCGIDYLSLVLERPERRTFSA